MNHGEQPIDEFLDDIASRRVAPAGGSAAAVVGAVGASLCEMACLHTVGRDDYADVSPELTEIAETLRTRRGVLLELADSDSEAVQALVDAGDDEGATVAKRATGVPLAIAEGCLAVLEGAVVVTRDATPRAAPDAGTGATLAHAALRATVFTVRHNAGTIEDRSFAEEMRTRATEVESAAADELEQVRANLDAEL